MYVHITGTDTAPAAIVRDRDDLGRLSVWIDDDLHLTSVASALAPVLTPEGEKTVWIESDWLRRASGFTTSSASEKFDKMLDFARIHGFVDDSERVRAHIERVPVSGRSILGKPVGDEIRTFLACERLAASNLAAFGRLDLSDTVPEQTSGFGEAPSR